LAPEGAPRNLVIAGKDEKQGKEEQKRAYGEADVKSHTDKKELGQEFKKSDSEPPELLRVEMSGLDGEQFLRGAAVKASRLAGSNRIATDSA